MSTIISGYHYDIGGREVYEDRVDAQNITTAAGLALVVGVVADGVGGENKGERAAQVAKDAVLAYIRRGQEEDVPSLLENAVQFANQAVYQEAQDTEGASTTLAVAAILDGETLYVANVGDSRIYLCRNDKLTQLTIDHTFATVMPWQNKLSAEAAREHPRADILMLALGSNPKVPVDIGFYVSTSDPQKARERGRKGLPLREGDSILVCSDGLIGISPQTGEPFATDEEIVQVLTTQEGTKAARSLISFALGRNANDNVSAAVLQTPDPARGTIAQRSTYLIGAVVLAVIVIAAILLLLYSNWRSQVEEEEALLQAATSEVMMSRTAVAQEVAAAAVEATKAANATAGTQNVYATATAEAIELAKNVAAAGEALNATATANAQIAADEATRAAEETRCLQIDNYSLELAGEPVFDPPPPYTYVRGNSVPSINAIWTVVNNGKCPWRDLRLRPAGDGDWQQPELRQNGVLISEIGAGETAEIVLSFDKPSEVQDLDEEWIFVVASDGGDLTLIDLDHLVLQLKDWINIKDPTATPTLTPTATPIPTDTPIPPTSSSDRGGDNSGNGGGSNPPPPRPND